MQQFALIAMKKLISEIKNAGLVADTVGPGRCTNSTHGRTI